MPYVLPVDPIVPDEQVMTAPRWELAAPTYDVGPQVPRGNEVTMNHTGAGDTNPIADQYVGTDLYVVGRQGVMNGEQLFIQVPDPPNEGHGEYSFAQDGPKIDHSTRLQAIFWSDWYGSTAAQAGGGGSFHGEHVVIARIPPGSTQGYMPTQHEQLNTQRQTPSAWDTLLTIGGG
jgi:hypothetical protein